MRRIRLLATVIALGCGVRALYRQLHARATAKPGTSIGHDTATGTDPDAKWSVSGYEDKSLGQAVNADADLVDKLVDESDGDLVAAEARFREESAGSPALARQARENDH